MIRQLSNDKSAHWPIMASAVYLLITMVAFFREQWSIVALPVAMVVALLAFFKPKYLLFAIVFLTPFSINLEELGRGEIAFYLPTEPLLFGFMIVILLGQLHSQVIAKAVIIHPVSIAIYIYFAWLFVTSLTSVQPIVSIKYLISRAWFIVPIFFAGATIFLNHRNISKFLLLYLVPFIGIVIYTTLRHANYGFEEDPAHWVMEPFYRDHTQYGAVAAFFIPVVFGFVTRTRQSWEARFLGLLSLILLFVTLVYTYSRAALLSVVVAFVIWAIVKSVSV
ncbi:MAG: hypothetical protein IPL46_27030 [Saprospiraceae bacterium]|nr:hypothetical protein [Saprospiraceae bacterium]